MGATEFALGDALAVQRWSAELAIEAEVSQYFGKWMGAGPENVLLVRKDLKKAAGERIIYGLEMKITGDGVEGDNVIEGTSAETAMVYYNDSIYIDQRRKGTKIKGKMTQQRVPYQLRNRGRAALGVWYAEDYDQQIFMYLSGARGIDTSFHVPLGWTGRASNTLTAPDSSHTVYGGDATSLADIESNDKMNLKMVEKLIVKLETLDPMVQPFKVDGENRHILLMHTYQAYDLRTSISQGDWLEIHKATDGQKSPIYKNALGEFGGMVLHKHRNVIRFDSTTGCASGITAARALCLGAQAGCVAWGGGSDYGRYSWNEETDDRGNSLVITAGAIYGVKRTIYNSLTFGLVAVDTYAADPNA